MPHYRRWYIPGSTYFFTVVTAGRRPIFADAEACHLLGDTLRHVRAERPFETFALVLLPDHLHTLWALPPGDADFSTRWAAIKARFTRAWLDLSTCEASISPARIREARRGIWQPRFFEHWIRDDRDLKHHFDYIHFNPIKHGLVRRARDWPWSTFARFVEGGEYDPDWGKAEDPEPDTAAVNSTLAEGPLR